MIALSVADTICEKKLTSYKTVNFEQKLFKGKSSLDAKSVKTADG